jgi:HAD superfamily hydrolase (TIGR01490 family)
MGRLCISSTLVAKLDAVSHMPGYLALFDMDRTLLDINTAALYVRWRRQHGLNTNLDVLRVGLWILQYKFGLLNAPRIAEKVMQQFRGDREDELQLDCIRWYEQVVRLHIMTQGRTAIEHHRNLGAVLALITSATRYAAEPLAKDLGIPHVLCTELEVNQAGCFTGRIIKPMCFGEGKVRRAKDWAQSTGLELKRAYFYTDSITDAPLMRIVDHPVAVNPDPRLKRLARVNSWRIEYWQT